MEYGRILQELNFNSFNLDEDRYSGVFLPVPFEEYWSSRLKIMLVGRETAGWNTGNEKNTIKRIMDFSEKNKIHELVSEAVKRYKRHLLVGEGGQVVTKTTSRFKQYFFRIAKELQLDPRSIVYSNIFAWDYDKRSPRARPESEFKEIASISKQILAKQIEYMRPDVIVFSSGFAGTDTIIKQLFNENFGGYESKGVVPGKYWEFESANARCFRIAHPRATNGHGEFRDRVIERIKDSALG